MRRRTVLLVVALVALALAIPSGAEANWVHKGQGELKSNATLTLKGNLTLSSSAGNVVCAAQLETTLTGSSSNGHVSSFTVSKPSECDLTGSLAAICGTNGVTGIEKTGTWGVLADEGALTISSIDIHYTLKGCLIPSFRLKGSAVATPDKASAIGTVTLSGSQTLYNSLGEEAGSGKLEGTLAATPAGTYGLIPAPTVETIWRMGSGHLSEDGELTLAGQFSFSGSVGGVTCSINAKANLLSETIEEGDPEGTIESFTVASPSACDVTGTLKSTCGTNSVTGVEKTGTWDLTATEEDIGVANAVIDFKFAGCATPSLRVAGDLKLTVDDPEHIGETSLAGSLSVYNATEEKIGTASAGGTQTASPADTYGLVPTPPPPPCGEGSGEEGSVNWAHEGEPLTEPACIELKGPMAFGTGFFGFAAVIDLEILLLPGSTGKVVDFALTDCTGTGALAGLTCTNTSVSEWKVVADESGTFTIESVSLPLHFYGPADTTHSTKLTSMTLTGDFLAIPDNSSEISSVWLEGIGTQIGGNPAALEGELEVLGENVATYGLV